LVAAVAVAFAEALLLPLHVAAMSSRQMCAMFFAALSLMKHKIMGGNMATWEKVEKMLKMAARWIKVGSLGWSSLPGKKFSGAARGEGRRALQVASA